MHQHTLVFLAWWMAPANNHFVPIPKELTSVSVWDLQFLNYNSTVQITFQQRSNFVRKKQRYVREFEGPWQQELRAFITRVGSISLWRAVPSVLWHHFLFLKTSFLSLQALAENVHPEPYHLPDSGTPTPMFQGFKYKFPDKIFFYLLSLAQVFTFVPVVCDERGLESHIIT